MENRKIFNYIIYILPIILGLFIIYISYNFIVNSDKKIDISKTYIATFLTNGADSITQNTIICTMNHNKCEVTLPSITRKDGYVLGWNIENSNDAKYKVGQVVSINKDTTFYAITYQEYNLTIAKKNEVDYLSNDIISCKAYNNSSSCKVAVPNFNKTGYENRGYSLRDDALTGIIFPNNDYVLKKDITLYPVFNTLTRQQVINISKTINQYGITIEIENGCDSNTYNEYLEYFNKIYEKANYLLIGSKITFLNANTFDNLWGSKYLGMNYGPNSLRLFDVKCPSKIDQNYYATIVHELAHTWDFYYGNFFSKNISDESDIINIFTKYKNMSDRPFRNYSYSNIKEFFADCVRYYYFKYIDPNILFSNLDYPDDIKKTLEKYICITNNNYNITGCII